MEEMISKKSLEERNGIHLIMKVKILFGCGNKRDERK